ncbi:hypothetical protein E2562_022304 [Oryza meyeriana var. granulata]|uniref:Uncharacterized protein n=1 Tax=Oryza meyeriana var. granulata TaxID=110450 RepID=A0A6G1D504_9ORYZ|nr:hypothetical protein E2562_022304 [Oryza meyeriana var. granulata]KAF0907916.1 hypothetical protein E2562_022304 [Oryza meyeriana var. granulata]
MHAVWVIRVMWCSNAFPFLISRLTFGLPLRSLQSLQLKIFVQVPDPLLHGTCEVYGKAIGSFLPPGRRRATADPQHCPSTCKVYDKTIGSFLPSDHPLRKVCQRWSGSPWLFGHGSAQEQHGTTNS